jgi:aryl-alcohol dehydrogenase-like predicted oxidoreductase
MVEHGVRSWEELVYGFLLAQENVATAIAGTTSAEHLAENTRIAAAPPAIPRELVAGILAVHSDWMARA